MLHTTNSEVLFTIKNKCEVPMRDQMKASAYHLKTAEVKKLIFSATNFRDRCLIKTLFWSGLRRKELVELDVRDIDSGQIISFTKGIPVGESRTVSFAESLINVPIPSSLAAGTYYLGAIIDYAKEVNGSDETNNTASTQITLTEIW